MLVQIIIDLPARLSSYFNSYLFSLIERFFKLLMNVNLILISYGKHNVNSAIRNNCDESKWRILDDKISCV